MANIDILRDFIGRTETGEDEPASYNVIIGRNENKLAKPITAMTLAELLAAQKTWLKLFKVSSGAAGKYQIIRPTLLSLIERMKIGTSEKFTPAVQDQFCTELLKMRGLDVWLRDGMSDESFMLNLAKEWASFPVPNHKNGNKVSYYQGDRAGNKALVTVDQVREVLRQVKADAERPKTPVSKDKPVPAPKPAPEAVARPWNWTKVGVLIALLLAAAVALFIFI